MMNHHQARLGAPVPKLPEKTMTNDSETITETSPMTVPPAPTKAKRAARAKPAKAVKPAKAAKAKATPRVGKPKRVDLPIAEMTKDERALLRVLYTPTGERVGKAIHELQKQLWPKSKGTSKARNTLRRLVKFQWVESQPATKAELAAHLKAKSGRLYSKYQISLQGRKRGITG